MCFRSRKWRFGLDPDEFHQTFNFRFLDAGWDKAALVSAINESFEAFDEVGAPSTWVLNNHDVIRHVSRFGGDFGRTTASDGIGPDAVQPDNTLGLEKARAATLFMLGLPGASYLYQGEELGLPEHTNISPEHRQDPTFARTSGQRVGRDGARVPLPWTKGGTTNGFTSANSAWLPQPESFADLSRDQQTRADSTLEMYKSSLKLRSELGLGEGLFFLDKHRFCAELPKQERNRSSQLWRGLREASSGTAANYFGAIDLWETPGQCHGLGQGLVRELPSRARS